MEKKVEKEWYDDANIVTSLLLGLLVLIIIISQAFAIRNQLGFSYMLQSLFNYNTVYLFFLAYFIFLKTKVGKRYFNLMNLILTVLQVLVLFGSILDVIQFFGLGTLFNLILNLVLLIYMVYVLMKETRLWEVLHFDGLQLHLIKNRQFFTAIACVSIIILVIELIDSIEFDHVVLKLLECIYSIGFARYLYLYQDYKEEKVRQQEQKEEEELSETTEFPELNIEQIAKEEKEDQKTSSKRSGRKAKDGDKNE